MTPEYYAGKNTIAKLGCCHRLRDRVRQSHPRGVREGGEMRDWADVARGAALLLIPGAFVAALVMIAVMGIASLATREPVSTWPESAEFSQLVSGQGRFSTHGTNLAYWEVVVDHETGAQYLCRYKYGICPLLDADGSPLLVAEAGEVTAGDD